MSTATAAPITRPSVPSRPGEPGRRSWRRPASCSSSAATQQRRCATSPRSPASHGPQWPPPSAPSPRCCARSLTRPLPVMTNPYPSHSDPGSPRCGRQPTRADVLTAYAGVCTLIGRRAARIFEVVHRAAGEAAEIAELWGTLTRNRRAGADMVVRRAIETGPLRAGLRRRPGRRHLLDPQRSRPLRNPRPRTPLARTRLPAVARQPDVRGTARRTSTSPLPRQWLTQDTKGRHTSAGGDQEGLRPLRP